MRCELCLLMNFKKEAFFGKVVKSMLKKHRELTVDIVKFILVFAVILFQIFLIHFLRLWR
mgnify:CR=1 FL=1